MKGRFAPSPTGDLHLGNARTALLAWLQVRSAGGRFVMRVEDLDPGRVREEYVDTQLADLRWLGLDWDEGPDVGGPDGSYRQSRRQELYASALRTLDEEGLLYPCYCSRREIAEASSAPHQEHDEGPAYPGTCSGGVVERDRRKRSSALRFRVPPGEVRFVDLLYGSRSFEPAVETGDFVVRRKDGVAAYQLAVVVDDAAMSITDVLRGADLLSSTARQLLLYRALGLSEPRWAHVPLLLDADGDRFSKRGGALSLRELREHGASAERLVGWLAFTCGLLARPHEVRPSDLVPDFAIDRLPREDTPVQIPPWLRADQGTAP